MSAHDRWLESGAGGPDDDREVSCEPCDGTGTVLVGYDERDCTRRSCAGTGRVLASDDCEVT